MTIVGDGDFSPISPSFERNGDEKDKNEWRNVRKSRQIRQRQLGIFADCEWATGFSVDKPLHRVIAR
jgi:hypothetical protein